MTLISLSVTYLLLYVYFKEMGLLLPNMKQVYFNDYSFYTQVFKNFRITKAPNSVARSFAEILLGERKAVYNFHNRRHTEYS